MAQFGIHGNPGMQKVWSAGNKQIKGVNGRLNIDYIVIYILTKLS
jgi:hypothetical protein